MEAKCPEGFVLVTSKLCVSTFSMVMIGIMVVGMVISWVYWWKESKEKALLPGGEAKEQTLEETLREMIAHPKRALARHVYCSDGAARQYVFLVVGFGLLYLLVSVYQAVTMEKARMEAQRLAKEKAESANFETLSQVHEQQRAQAAAAAREAKEKQDKVDAIHKMLREVAAAEAQKEAARDAKKLSTRFKRLWNKVASL